MERAFLIRFDDVCPTMNWDVWQQVERVVRAAEVKPIIAVVPDNRHEKLAFGPPRENFWDDARAWRSLGWSIGMHGYQHSEMTRDGGLLGINRWSEFAGLDRETQRRRLAAALDIFITQKLHPDVWVAPGASFDDITLSLLRDHGLFTVSDGFTMLPFEDERGLFWIPQQLWRFRNMPAGIWTISFHVNLWTHEDIRKLERDIEQFGPWISDVATIRDRYGGRSLRAGDRAFASVYRRAVRARRKISDARASDDDT